MYQQIYTGKHFNCQLIKNYQQLRYITLLCTTWWWKIVRNPIFYRVITISLPLLCLIQIYCNPFHKCSGSPYQAVLSIKKVSESKTTPYAVIDDDDRPSPVFYFDTAPRKPFQSLHMRRINYNYWSLLDIYGKSRSKNCYIFLLIPVIVRSSLVMIIMISCDDYVWCNFVW